MNNCCDSPSYGLTLASKPKRKFDNFASDGSKYKSAGAFIANAVTLSIKHKNKKKSQLSSQNVLL